MRSLIVLGLVQTGILLVILFRLPGDASPGNAELQSSSPSQPHTQANPFARQETASQSAGPEAVSEARLRSIVREELQRAVAELAVQGGSQAAVQPQRRPVDPRQRDQVLNQIEYYRGMGEISAQEMSELMHDIARLDEQARQEALSRLTMALNRQEIDGRF